MKRRLLSMFCALALCLGLLPATALADNGTLTYQYYNTESGQMTEGTYSGDYTTVTSSDTAWGTSGQTTWYVVSDNVTNTERNNITVSGTVNLILTSGKTLTLNGPNISLQDSSAVLNIYGQAGNTGKLSITAGNSSGDAGINLNGGTLNIHGGTVTATGYTTSATKSAPGIDVGTSTLTVYGGEVTAEAGTYNSAGYGAGIRVVTDGTAKNAQVAGFSIGGKTGTSEKIDVFDENGQRVQDKIVSFVGIAPMNDPEYIVLVALDTPSRETGIYISGGVMAAPTVGAVMADILPYLGVERSYADTDPAGVELVMEDLTGLTVDEAGSKLKELGLTGSFSGTGETVVGQIPAPGQTIPGGSQVLVYLQEQPEEGGDESGDDDDPYKDVPDFVQPTGAHDAYNVGDRVKYNEHVYESLIAGNTYSPDAYPQGWKLLA